MQLGRYITTSQGQSMSFVLKKSTIDPALFEIALGVEVIKEIPIAFRIFRIPRQFASIQEIEQWVEREEKRLAKRAAYRLLAARNQSSSELRKKLILRGFSSLVIVEIVEELKRLGMISDADFEIALIERELKRGHGPRYIEMKLRSMGLNTSQIRRIVDENVQREAIRKLIPKLRNPATALQRRGFDTGVIFLELKNSLYRG
jgi:SOS response regulatory protein OraA/RecX